jgi:hypothetical protein
MEAGGGGRRGGIGIMRRKEQSDLRAQLQPRLHRVCSDSSRGSEARYTSFGQAMFQYYRMTLRS